MNSPARSWSAPPVNRQWNARPSTPSSTPWSVCYAQIPRAQRVDKHRRAAAWIEEASGERLEDHAEILAAHYSTAFELAQAAKDAASEDLEGKARRFLVLAGDRAMGIEVEAAERHYARALAMTSESHPDRPHILARHGEALRQRGRFPEASRVYEEAIKGFRAGGDVRAMAVSMALHSFVLQMRGDAGYRSASADALAVLEPIGPSAELVQVLTEYARASFLSSEYQQAIALADRAIDLAGELHLPRPARALGYRGASRAWHGDAEGVEDMRSALEAAAVQGLGEEVGTLYNNLAEMLGPIEGPRARLEMLRAGTVFAERRGIEELALVLTTNLGEVLFDLGSYDEAMVLLGELTPRLEEAGDVFDQVFVRSNQVHGLIRRGEPAEASLLAEWAVERARDRCR